jgi:hypothetical protein
LAQVTTDFAGWAGFRAGVGLASCCYRTGYWVRMSAAGLAGGGVSAGPGLRGLAGGAGVSAGGRGGGAWPAGGRRSGVRFLLLSRKLGWIECAAGFGGLGAAWAVGRGGVGGGAGRRARGAGRRGLAGGAVASCCYHEAGLDWVRAVGLAGAPGRSERASLAVITELGRAELGWAGWWGRPDDPWRRALSVVTRIPGVAQSGVPGLSMEQSQG